MDPKAAVRLQAELAEEVKKVQEGGKRLQALLSQRSKLLTQQSENEMVDEELRGADAGEAVVWKVIGPALVKVEKEEAVANVQGRLKWFKEELQRIEQQTKEAEDARRQAQDKIARIQDSVRKAQQEAVQRQLGKA